MATVDFVMLSTEKTHSCEKCLLDHIISPCNSIVFFKLTLHFGIKCVTISGGWYSAPFSIFYYSRQTIDLASRSNWILVLVENGLLDLRLRFSWSFAADLASDDDDTAVTRFPQFFS